VPNLQKTITALPSGSASGMPPTALWRCSSRRASQEGEARQAAALWVECLERALMPLQQYALPIIYEQLTGIQKTTNTIDQKLNTLHRQVQS
jgi:hypothetical protein